jgi:hypothetical protein
MTSQFSIPTRLAGDLLMWKVHGPSPEIAEARAREMGASADKHQLGEWGVFPIGLGKSWWFDLTLANHISEAHLLLLFGAHPDEIY